MLYCKRSSKHRSVRWFRGDDEHIDMDDVTAQFGHILARAAATGEIRRLDLPRDAVRLAVRVRTEGTIQHIMLTVAKRGRRLSSTEELRFRSACQVPQEAERTPPQITEQQQRVENRETWHLVAFAWTSLMANE